MRTNVGGPLAAAVAVGVLAGCADGGSPEPSDLEGAPAEGASVSVVDFAFEPDDATVRAGELVRFTNDGGATHALLSESFDTGEQEPGDVFRYVTSEAEAGRTIDYRCTIHPRMEGRITVEG